MDSVTTSSTRQMSALRQIWSSPLYRGATIAMFLSGLGTSAAAPQIVLFLVKELGASLPLAGLFYLSSLAAPIAGYAVGSYSDRTGGRLGLFRLCALAGFVGWAGIAVSTQIWMPFVISTLVLGFSGAAASQVFAALHDDLSKRPSPSNETIVAIVRMALTAGWVIGPVVGAWIAAAIGLRPLLWVTAICFLVQIVPLGTLNVSAAPKATAQPGSDVGEQTPGWRPMLPLLAFTGLFILVYVGESIKYGFLLLHMEDNLKLDAGARGAVIGIQPLIELIIMPFSILFARKLGVFRLMAVAALCGVVANICFAAWGSAAGMFAGQILMGGVWGVFAALGIIVAQRLLPQAVATASAIFMSSSALSSALGGITGGLGVAWIGLPQVFYLPAIFSGIAAIGLLVMANTDRLSSPRL